MKKIVKQAMEAQKQGYTHIASIVKQCYHTKYYHVVAIADVIEKGDWVPAPRTSGMPWHGRIGVAGSKVNWSVTVKKAQLPA